jgi:hypothetical protein
MAIDKNRFDESSSDLYGLDKFPRRIKKVDQSASHSLVSKDEIATQIQMLREVVIEQKPKKCLMLIESMHQMNLGTFIDQKLNDLHRAIKHYDFESARRILEDIGVSVE